MSNRLHGSAHTDLLDLSERGQKELLEALHEMFDGEICQVKLEHERVELVGQVATPSFSLICTRRGNLRGVRFAFKFTDIDFRPRHRMNRTVVIINPREGFAHFEIWPRNRSDTNALAKIHISKVGSEKPHQS